MTYTEERVTIEGAYQIGATITYQDKDARRPAVVIIAGTGKMNRDGSDGTHKMDLYKNFAEMFSEWGYNTVRYDKRGTFESKGDFYSTGLSDLVDDAASVVRYMKSLPYVDPEKVLVFGHSEGGIVATILTQKEDVAGTMLIGSIPMTLKDALYYQNELVANECSEATGLKGLVLSKAANEEKNIAKVDSMFQKAKESDKDCIRFSGVRVCAKWLREHDSYTSEDFITMLNEFGKPVLAIIGDKDLSADCEKLELLKDIPNVQCYCPENVNHLLREVDDDNSIMSVKKQYMRLSSRPVHQETQDIIRGWLESVSN